MKKNQESQFNTTKSGARRLRTKKIPLIAKIAAGVSFAMCILMLILFLIAKGSFSGSKTAVVIGMDGYNVQELSFKYAIASAGFEPVFIDEADDISGVKDDSIVVIAIGPDSFGIMDSMLGNAEINALGFCLIDPSYPGNAATEGYSTVSPDVPIAIFGFDSDMEDPATLPDPALIFERISGVDTVYGEPAGTGGASSYKIFASPDMQRFLYLATDTKDLTSMLESTSFKTEIARFLALRFDGDYDPAGVNSWFILRILALFIGLAALLVFLFFIPVPTPDKGEKRLKGKDSLALIIVTGAGEWLALCTVVFDIIPQTKRFAPYIVILAPACLIFLMFILRAGYYLSNKTSFERRQEKITNYLITAILEVLLVLTALLVFTDIAEESKPTHAWLSSGAILLLNTFTVYALAAVDKKSRFSGEGAASYFGNPLYLLDTMLPSAAGIIAALALGEKAFLTVSLTGLAIASLPYLASQTIKRSSDFCLLAGIVHGIISAMLVFLAWK